MRVNIYHHEIGWMASRAEHVTKHVEDTGVTFHGVRLPTEALREHEPGDDDSAAVTLWFPWTRADGHDTTDMRSIAYTILRVCDEIDTGQIRLTDI